MKLFENIPWQALAAILVFIIMGIVAQFFSK